MPKRDIIATAFPAFPDIDKEKSARGARRVNGVCACVRSTGIESGVCDFGIRYSDLQIRRLTGILIWIAFRNELEALKISSSHYVSRKKN